MFTGVVWVCYNADGTDLETILFFSAQCAFALKSDNHQTNGTSDRTDDGNDNWELEGMVTPKEVVTFGTRGELQGV